MAALMAALFAFVAVADAQSSHPVTAPPTPAPVVIGSNLQGTPENPFGDTKADFESYPYFAYAYANAFGGAPHHAPEAARGPTALLDPFAAHLASTGGSYEFPLVPVTGLITSFTVKGYTETSNILAANGSGDIRLGIDQPMANGQLTVVSTSNPQDELPSTPGTYTFKIGPPATGFNMLVTKGQVLSLDTPGGAYAVYAAQQGAEVETYLGHGGSEASPGMTWTGTPHPNVELLMSVSIEPRLSVTTLQTAEGVVKQASASAHAAVFAKGTAQRTDLRKAAATIKQATGLVATAKDEGIVSDQTAATLDYFLTSAYGNVNHKGAKGSGRAQRLASAAGHDLLTAYLDVITARQLASKVP